MGPATLISGAGAPARLFPASSVGPHKSIANEFLVLPYPVQGFSSLISWGVSQGPEAVWLSYPVYFSPALIAHLSCRERKSSHSTCIQKTSFSSTWGSLQSSRNPAHSCASLRHLRIRNDPLLHVSAACRLFHGVPSSPDLFLVNLLRGIQDSQVQRPWLAPRMDLMPAASTEPGT